jgi:hypothetical protein
MTIVRCPRCRDELAVPARATSRALVRCPLCLEEYLLAEALSNAPPPLVIIGGEVEQAAIHSPDAADEYRLAGGPFTADVLAAAAPEPTHTAPRPALRTTTRPRRKEKSGVLLLVNYVGGGVMGLSLGLLVLWWGFRRDPLDAGPKVALYVPWLVPAEFRGQPASTNPDQPARPSRTISRSNPADARPSDDSATIQNRPAAINPSAAISGEELQSLPPLEAPVPSPGAARSPTIEAPILTDPTAQLPTHRVEPANEETLAAAPRPPAPDLTDLLPENWSPFVVTPADDRRFPSVTDLTAAVHSAAAALKRYDDVPKEDAEGRRQAFIEMHTAIGEVGRLLSYRGPAGADLSQPIGELEQLFLSLAGKKGTLNAARFLTAQSWPELPDGQGFFAAGTVKQIQAAGPLFEMTLESTVRDTTASLPVITVGNPRDLCQPGDELIVVGRLVEQPKLNLPGYGGDQPRVLTAGFAWRVPKAE